MGLVQEASLTKAQPRTSSARLGLAIILLGAGVLVASAFLPQESPDAGSLWREGTGATLVALAAVAGGLTFRAHRRGNWSWAPLGVGALAALNAVALGISDDFTPRGAGLVALALAAVLLIGGWGVGFAGLRPALEGLGPWGSLPRSIREAHAPPDPASRPLALSSPVLWSLPLYALISLAYWGLPIAGEFDSALIAENPIDPNVYTWFYAWWPQALLDGANPFVTDAIFVPEGYNLTWVTAVPGPSLLLAPVTLALGPVVTYNVIGLAAPALAAWTAFLLCRHLTASTAPALVGGYIFGFSPYMLRMEQGSPHLYLVALVPLFVLLVVRRLEGSLSERAFFVAMTAGLAVQYLTSLDVLATTSIFGATSVALAFWLWPERRALILRTGLIIGAAYVGAAVVVSPVLFHMFAYEHTTPAQNNPFFANDLVSWFLPDSSMLVADGHEPGATPPQYGGLAYFGIPLLLVVALFLKDGWKSRGGRLLGLMFLVAAVAGLGHRLTFNGDLTRIGLPWAVVDHLPALKLLVPQRFPMFAFLAASVMAAMWLVGRRSTGIATRGALVAVAMVFMVPWVFGDYWKTPVTTPPFFSSGEYRSYLRAGERVLTVPIIGESMRWQAEEDFRFDLAGGGVGAFPESYVRYPAFSMLISGELTPDYGRDLRRFIEDKGVTAVVVDKVAFSPERRRLFSTLGVSPLDTGGVFLYLLPASLQSRSSVTPASTTSEISAGWRKRKNP